MIGTCPVTATRLRELVTGVRTAPELDALARALPGCFHLVASINGVVRVQGSLAGLRRVFHTRVEGVPVAGDRADVLAGLAGPRVDEQTLAVWVACGALVPPPVGERSGWQGVRMLAPDHYLRIDPDGAVSEPRWWQPPRPQLGLTAGSGAVRAALETAVAARRPSQGRLSADLSGGMDSSSLCFLAARAGMPDLLTFRRAEADVANDDAVFAAHAMSRLPRAEHLVLPQADIPDIFADPGATGDTEAPYRLAHGLARIRHNVGLLVSRGARHHLAGHGGDELFRSPLPYLHPLLRRRPLTAIRWVRGYRALHRWPLAATVSALALGGGLGAWWHQQARQLSNGPPPRRRPDLGWGKPLRAPVWVTPAALDAAKTVLHTTGDQAQPLGSDRGQHADLAALRMMTPQYRQLGRVYADGGLRLELPYLDDRVVEAVLAVHPYERTTPRRYKPLLVEAMRPILPEQIAARTTKGEFGKEVYDGLRRHLPEVLEVFADSALAAHGLINPDLLRRQLLAPQVDNTVVQAMSVLLGCETWLRATQTPSSLGRNNVAAASL